MTTPKDTQKYRSENKLNVGILFEKTEKEEIDRAIDTISRKAGLVRNMKTSTVLRDWVLKQVRQINEQQGNHVAS